MKSTYTRWNIARTVLTFIGYALLAIAWWVAVRHVPKLPVEVGNVNRQEIELQRHVEKTYEKHNQQWFNGKLPADTKIKIFHNITYIALTSLKTDGTFTIEFNPDFLPTEHFTDLTLFHEECHLYTWTKDTHHGEAWQSCMKDLAKWGAFDNLW